MGSDWTRRVQTLTFDCYGTLIDWSKGLAGSFTEIFGDAFRRHEREFFDAYVEVEAALEADPYQSYRDILSATVEQLARRFNLSLPAGRAHQLAESLPRWTPFADTNDALRRLKQQYRLGVLSNIDRDLFAGTAKHFAIEFDFLITAEDVKSYKPGSGHFERMLAAEGDPTKVLHVAQSLYHDGAAAQEHHLAFAWINRYKQTNRTGVRPTVETPDLQSLADLLCPD